ncbi:hypothetical protein TB1_046538 [Malus domestica]
MLDSNFNAKLGDFGLARLVDHGKEPKTTALAGTMGYMAPEYVITRKASKESDLSALKTSSNNEVNVVEWRKRK